MHQSTSIFRVDEQNLAPRACVGTLLGQAFVPPLFPSSSTPPKPDLQNYSRIALRGWLFVHFDVRGGPRRSRRGPGGRFRPKVLRTPGQKSPARLPSGTQLRGGLPQGNFFFIGTRPASPLSHNNLHKKTTRATIRPPHGQVAPREKWHDGNHTRQLRKPELEIKRLRKWPVNQRREREREPTDRPTGDRSTHWVHLKPLDLETT